ncbi:MAG: general secretion pathway protein G, partial [Hyphomicrobiaceae bacterium]
FTLIELLVVMVILGLLASLVAPNIFGAAEKAKVQSTRVQISSLSTSLDAFALDNGRYPNSSEGLEALVSAPSGLKRWDGPYMKKLPSDGWQNAFVYSPPTGGSDYTIKSLGSDGVDGGDGKAGDITNND